MPGRKPSSGTTRQTAAKTVATVTEQELAKQAYTPTQTVASASPDSDVKTKTVSLPKERSENSFFAAQEYFAVKALCEALQKQKTQKVILPEYYLFGAETMEKLVKDGYVALETRKNKNGEEYQDIVITKPIPENMLDSTKDKVLHTADEYNYYKDLNLDGMYPLVVDRFEMEITIQPDKLISEDGNTIKYDARLDKVLGATNDLPQAAVLPCTIKMVDTLTGAAEEKEDVVNMVAVETKKNTFKLQFDPVDKSRTIGNKHNAKRLAKTKDEFQQQTIRAAVNVDGQKKVFIFRNHGDFNKKPVVNDLRWFEKPEVAERYNQICAEMQSAKNGEVLTDADKALAKDLTKLEFDNAAERLSANGFYKVGSLMFYKAGERINCVSADRVCNLLKKYTKSNLTNMRNAMGYKESGQELSLKLEKPQTSTKVEFDENGRASVKPGEVMTSDDVMLCARVNINIGSGDDKRTHEVYAVGGIHDLNAVLEGRTANLSVVIPDELKESYGKDFEKIGKIKTIPVTFNAEKPEYSLRYSNSNNYESKLSEAYRLSDKFTVEKNKAATDNKTLDFITKLQNTPGLSH